MTTATQVTCAKPAWSSTSLKLLRHVVQTVSTMGVWVAGGRGGGGRGGGSGVTAACINKLPAVDQLKAQVHNCKSFCASSA